MWVESNVASAMSRNDTADDGGVPFGDEQDRPESEKWRYDGVGGFGSAEGSHLGGEWWIDDEPGDVAMIRILEVNRGGTIPINAELETADGFSAGIAVRLRPADARRLAEDLREVADALEEE